jgi:hypothetical protein
MASNDFIPPTSSTPESKFNSGSTSPTYVFSPDTTPPSNYNQYTQTKIGNDRHKPRIYQEFAHNIILDELSIPADNTPGNNKEQSSLSLEFPFVRINDYILSKIEIDDMKIDCTGFIPRISLTCTFSHQTFLSRDMPKDGDIISIAIRNKSDILKSIRNDYVITGVISSQNAGRNQSKINTMTFFGTLFVPGLASSKGKFSYIGTSLETLREYAKWLGLGFAHNEVVTDDKQAYIYTKFGNNDSDFPENIASTAYADSTSFFSVWIDIYYNLNFININKQLMAAENEVDIAAWINNIDKDFTYGDDTEESKTVESPKVLSNYAAFRTTPFFINSWKPYNKASKITFDIGTKTWCQLFEHTPALYSDDTLQKFWTIEMEPTYDPDKVNKYILLRGRASQDIATKGKDLAIANNSYVDIYARYPWMGVQYSISNPDDDNLQWDGNHHKNYYRAKVQNLINNKELEKLTLEIQVNGLNLNIIKADKIPVALIKTDPIENKMINPANESQDMLDQFYSGWFLVKGYTINYDRTNANKINSNFSQTFVLSRREWPPPIAVDAVPKT